MFGHAWFLWAMLALSCRVGEAKKPGPDWTVSVANPNGLNGKAFGFADSTHDVWLFSETHLTQAGIHTFWSNVRSVNPRYRAFQHGCPVAPRAETSDIGQWSGVGIMTTFPVRRLPHEWPKTAYHSGRLLCTSFCAHGIWISGVQVYGTPTGPTHPNAKEVTNQLLAQALDRIEQQPGPKYIAGDFNHDLDHLTTVSVLTRLGYRDLQDLEAERTGRLPVATCRGKTRRDFMLVSRELAALFLECQVDDDTVSDHSNLIGRFRGGPDEVSRFVWPIPDQMEWEPFAQRQPVQTELFHDPECVTTDYQKFWHEVERHNQSARTVMRKPVIRAMTGRATQLMPTQRYANHAPLKTSRPGDRQPAFLGSCLQHAQWTKQLRRLQSYVRLSRSGPITAEHGVHQLQLWTSIRFARGFVPNFVSWWGNRNLGIGEPSTVPEQPPNHAVATLFYAGMELELEQLEKSLNASRSHANRLHKASDTNAMYRTVRRDVPAQVDSLALTLTAVVAEVDEVECALVTTHDMSWFSGIPIMHAGQPLTIIHHEADKVWCDTCGTVQPGDTLTQRRPVGRLEDLFHAFETQWSRLWNRHQDVPDSQWDQIIGFAQRQLRPVTVDPPDLSHAQVIRTLKRKSKHAATSLDGVSRCDLLALHPTDWSQLLRVFEQATTSGVWPRQVLQGYVRSLAKVVDPHEVGHFRPITVFSNLYRTWSSIAARHWLKAVSSTVDPFLCGNTVGGRAALVWRYMLEQIEQAHLGGEQVCGLSADLVKAFNILPRKPALAAVKLMGVDHGTLLAWAGALSGFVRHFVIQGSFSPGVESCNGFPEGCALSCLAMMALTQLFHSWMAAANVMFRPISYVDNWGVILRSVDYMKQACDAVDAFAAALSLDLDPAKSYCWASDRPGRVKLRADGFTVKLKNRELGAHVVFSEQISNFHSLERFRQLDDFWKKLASSPCTFRQKIILVQRVAWPRAFHAVSAVVIGRKHFEALRTNVMQALRLQKPGANPALQCSLEGATFDPLVFAAVETLRDARSLGDAGSVQLGLNMAVFESEKPTFNSLSEILCQRLHRLGFEVHADAIASDELGSFNFLQCSLQEFVMRAQWTWTKVLAVAVKHRRSFRGFEAVDLFATRKAYNMLDAYDQGIIRKYLHGATITNEHAQHWSEDGVATGVKCGAPDSTRHRLWECSATAELRNSIPDDVFQELSLLPSVSLEHGWTLRSPLANAWNQYLINIPSAFGFMPNVPSQPILDLFTDGSCLHPADSDFRMASWAVVQAPPFDLAVDRSHFMPVAAQPLAGLLQSAYRAELMAVLAALEYAIQSHACVRIWTDCQSVLKVYPRVVIEDQPIKPNGKHSDLLHRLKQLASRLGAERLAILKVPAHENRLDFENDLDRWLVDGNNAVDAAAQAANRLRPAEVWSLWSAYVEQTLQCRNQSNWIRSHMLSVSKMWVQSVIVQPVSVPSAARPVRVSRKQPDLVWDDPCNLVLQRPTFVRFFGVQLASDVQSWLGQIRDAMQPLRWISYLHLFISFQRNRGPWNILKRDGKWTAESGSLASLANHVRLPIRIKYFRLMLQQYFKDANVRYSCGTVRAFSQWVLCFKGSVGFQISHHEFEALEEYLSQQLVRPATGAGGSLDLLRGV